MRYSGQLLFGSVVYITETGELTTDNFGSCFHHSVKSASLALADTAEPYTH